MELFEIMKDEDYEQIVYCYDQASGLKAIICIHDTTLGPSLGGTRMWNYANENEAVIDVMRLARGMTYKNAAAGLNHGGGKAVIIGDPRTDKNEAMFRAFGRYIQGLNGRYITAEDVGTTEEDMDIIQCETDYVTGVSPFNGSGGTPSPYTAYGVFQGMKAAAEECFGSSDLSGKTVAVQGAGSVAYHLCRYLHEAGARLFVTDLYPQRVQRFVETYGAQAVDPEEIYSVECDIFSPNALGAVINDETLSELKCRIVAGAANNQLKQARHGERLREKGILYCPDFIINAGGVISVADELQGFNRERVMKKVASIYDTMKKVFRMADEQGWLPEAAANRIAEERIETLRKTRSTFLHRSKERLART